MRKTCHPASRRRGRTRIAGRRDVLVELLDLPPVLSAGARLIADKGAEAVTVAELSRLSGMHPAMHLPSLGRRPRVSC